MTTTTTKRPFIGAIVQLMIDTDPKPLAALVTEVHSPDCVNVVAFGSFGDRRPYTSVASEAMGEGAAMHWRWPVESSEG